MVLYFDHLSYQILNPDHWVDDPKAADARQAYAAGDFQQALQFFPYKYIAERAVLQCLIKSPNNFANALQQV